MRKEFEEARCWDEKEKKVRLAFMNNGGDGELQIAGETRNADCTFDVFFAPSR